MTSPAGHSHWCMSPERSSQNQRGKHLLTVVFAPGVPLFAREAPCPHLSGWVDLPERISGFSRIVPSGRRTSSASCACKYKAANDAQFLSSDAVPGPCLHLFLDFFRLPLHFSNHLLLPSRFLVSADLDEAVHKEVSSFSGLPELSPALPSSGDCARPQQSHENNSSS